MKNKNPQEHHEKHEELSAKTDGFKIFLSILAVILVISNVITIYFLLNKKDNNSDSIATPIVNENPGFQPANKEINDANEKEGDLIESEAEELLVHWYDEAIEVSPEELFGETKIALNKAESKNSILFDESLIIEKLGEIKEGLYSSAILYSILVQGPGMSITSAIKYNEEVFILNNKIEYDQCGNSYYKYLCEDKNIIIQNLESPEIINIPELNINLIKNEYTRYEKLNGLDNHKKLFEYLPGKFLYQSKTNYGMLQYFALAEDHTIRIYQLEMNFSGDEGSPVEYFGMTPKIFDIVWSDGSKNTTEFLKNAQAAHFYSQAYTYYINGIDELKITGYTANNQVIYELKDVSTKENESDSKSIFETMYAQYYVPADQEKISFEDFLNQHLLIIWEDPFGNFIEFRNAAYMPAAEFGKPVIYLYPEEITDVSVKVFPNKGLTITEPTYNDGWFVKAEPNGNLYNYNDKQTYPYLFWEGHGINYNMPKNGFIVAKADVEKFLVEKLSEQGLVSYEYDEFIEFWAPKMTEQPYYFITFMPQEEFDKLAPLEINPKPDTIIRVFMDYKGLDKQIEVNPQIFKTPQRNGFTVIEWGGALHN